ncbi:uncharacterized protein LOC144737085 isoform X1 [Lampetra planeri]
MEGIVGQSGEDPAEAAVPQILEELNPPRATDTEPGVGDSSFWAAASSDRRMREAGEGRDRQMSPCRKFYSRKNHYICREDPSDESSCDDDDDDDGEEEEEENAASPGIDPLQLCPSEDWDLEMDKASPYGDEELFIPPSPAASAVAPLLGAYFPGRHHAQRRRDSFACTLVNLSQLAVQPGQFDDARPGERPPPAHPRPDAWRHAE